MRKPQTDKIIFACMSGVSLLCVTAVIIAGRYDHIGPLLQLITTVFGFFMAWKVQPPQEGTTIVAHMDESLPSMKSGQLAAQLIDEVRTSQSSQNLPKLDMPVVDTGSGPARPPVPQVPIIRPKQ